MVYVYKKNKQIKKWNERINTKKKIKIKIRALWGFEPQNTVIAMSKEHLRSIHWANGGVEKYRLNVIYTQTKVEQHHIFSETLFWKLQNGICGKWKSHILNFIANFITFMST